MDRVTFKGFAYGAIAAASYGLNPLFALPLYADGFSVVLSLCLWACDAGSNDAGAKTIVRTAAM